MKFTPEDLGGLEFKTARRAVRYLRALDTVASNQGEPGADVDLIAFKGKTGLDFDAVEPILLRQGYIQRITERNRGNCYTVTDLGYRLTKTALAKRLYRQEIDSLFEDVNLRVAEVQQDNRFLYWFTNLIVFGSFLRQQLDYGDIDLTARLQIKPKFREWSNNERSEHHLRYFPADYRDTLPYLLGRERALRHVIARRKRIDFIEISQFMDLLETNPTLDYRVLIGRLEKELG
jgi:hypothetical protein